MSMYCIFHLIFLSVNFALFAAAVPRKPNLEDVVERLLEVESRLKDSKKEIDNLRETTRLQKVVIENQGIRIQTLESEVSGQGDIINVVQEKAAVTNQEVKGLRNKLRSLLNRRIPFESKVNQDRTSSKNGIRSSNQTLRRQVSSIGGGIAFTAYLDHDADLGADQTIKYNKVITNDGNGYNPHTGVFTCPEGGTYMFTFFVGERSETDGYQEIWADLVVNSQVLMDAVAETSYAHHDVQGGNTVVIRLKPGDSVWVKSEDSGFHVEASTLRVTSFTGVYLYR